MGKKYKPDSNSHYEFYSHPLTSIIIYFIETAMKKKDWSIIAVDPVKNLVVFRRFTYESEND